MTKVIGQKLYISPYTVSRHLRNICYKCHARNSVHLITMFASIGTFPKTHPALSKRENQIMNLLVDGFSSHEIAHISGVSLATIRKHRENILWKLEVGSVRQATTLFITHSVSEQHY